MDHPIFRMRRIRRNNVEEVRIRNRYIRIHNNQMANLLRRQFADIYLEIVRDNLSFTGIIRNEGSAAQITDMIDKSR